MPSRTFAARTSGLLAAAALTGMLAACAAEPMITFTAPTMAPEQTLAEACAVSGAEVEQLTQQTEQQIRQSIEEAGARLANGELPSIDVLSGPLDSTLSEIETQLSNSELLAAVTEVRQAVQGFQDIARPESALQVPGYLAELGTQANELAQAGKHLQALCDANS